MTLTYRHRITLLALLAGLGGAVLLARLFAMQLLEGARWRAGAAEDVADVRPVHARRGRILDARGRELAVDEPGYELAVRAAAWCSERFECGRCGFVRFFSKAPAEPKCPRCKQSLAPADRRDITRLAGLLGMPAAQLIERVDADVAQVSAIVKWKVGELPPRYEKQQRALLWADYGWRPRRVVRDVPYEVAREVELNPRENPAFRIETFHARRAQGGRDFVHLLGQVRNETERQMLGGEPRWIEVPKALSGIEAAFDRVLRGEPGYLRILRDPRDGDGRVVGRHPPRHGVDLRLTIAAEDQARAMAALAGAQGAFILVHAEDGDVLAAATAPSYEPGEYARILADLTGEFDRTGKWPRHHALREAAFRDFHAPGSIVKPFTAIAALGAGVASPGTHVVCDRIFRNARGQPLLHLKCTAEHGDVDLHEALVRSCNVYFQTLQREMLEREALDRFLETGKRFGLGLPTGIELEPLPYPDTHRLGDTWADRIWAAIGQGHVELSPAQVARAYAALATGSLPRLRLVAEIGGRPVPTERAPLGVPEAALRAVRAALLEVPRRGTASGHGLDRWPLSAKTGTAQIGGELHNAWIAGFLPAHRGRPPVAFAMVLFDTPLHGGEACAPRLEGFLRGFYGEGGE
jgi:penicillin-binding protein 2